MLCSGRQALELRVRISLPTDLYLFTPVMEIDKNEVCVWPVARVSAVTDDLTESRGADATRHVKVRHSCWPLLS